MSTLKDLTTSPCAEEDDLFFFETDHLALKGNIDYSELLKTLIILQSQRLQAIKDYEEVAQQQKIALDDPVAFVERVRSGEKICPGMMQIVDVPTVNWDKYKVKPNPILLQQLNTNKQDDELLNVDKLKDKGIKTYKVSWTIEEQKRLEELLNEFPPEPIELQRFKKIAAALGTRTIAQVTSRVQKYFLKLAKLGLPVPGRMPKAIGEKMRKRHPHQRFNHLLLRPSTFFPELDIPVKMDDTDIAPGPSNDMSNASSDLLDEKFSNYLLPSASYLEEHNNAQVSDIPKANEAEIRVKLLKQIKSVKILEETIQERDLYRHLDYTCDYCDEEPIIGTRWHCYTCDISASIDYCTDCMISQILSSEPHNIAHKFITIGSPTKDDPVIEKSNPEQSDNKMTSDSESDNDEYDYDRNDQKYDGNQSGFDNDDSNHLQENDENDENETDNESLQDSKTEELPGVNFGDSLNYTRENGNVSHQNVQDFDFRNIKQEFVD